VNRRRPLLTLATVAVIATSIPLMRTLLPPIPEPRPDSPLPAIGSFGLPLPAWVPSDPGSYIYNVRWGDRTHGYALRGTCLAQDDCGVELMTTEDASQWRSRRLPTPDGKTESGLFQRLYVLGQKQLAVEAPRERWYSEDAGISWRKVPIGRGETVAAIPDRAILEPNCTVVSVSCGRLGEIQVMLPGSGRSASLANPPPLGEASPSQVPAADGGWWVSGRDPATGHLALAVSRDAGRSWSVSDLPDVPGVSYAGISVVVGPNAVYATEAGPAPGVYNGLLAIMRSTDSGRTWETTWVAHGNAEPRGISGVAVAGADGALTVSNDAGSAYASTDGGHTFTPTGRILGYVEWNRDGYFASAPFSTNKYAWSTDGVRWAWYAVG
jgi:photosystem II stability/assembly factor-like uncharacterized protein